MSFLPRNEVRCIECGEPNSFDFEGFGKGSFVRCVKCGEQFNIFGVWNSLYETNPICQRIVDVSLTHTDAKCYVQGDNANDQDRISQVLEENDFAGLKTLIFKDLILYGNSFILITDSNSIVQLSRLEPMDLRFKVEFLPDPPWKSWRERITEIVEFRNPSDRYDPEKVLHFRTSPFGYEPFVESVMGMWFHSWYFLGDWEDKMHMLDPAQDQVSKLKEFWGLEASIVVLAAGVPQELIFNWFESKKQIEHDIFQGKIERRRKMVSRVMEHTVFPQILGRPYDRENCPRLRFVE